MAESRYEIKKDGKAIQKTVWFYEMKVVESYNKEPDQEIEEIASQLSKYLSPQLYDSIFSGEKKVSIESEKKFLTNLHLKMISIR